MVKYLIIALVIFLILLFAILLFTRTSISPQPSPEPSFSAIPNKPFSISSVLPENNSKNVNLSAEIMINFSRPLREDEQESVIFSAEPVIEGFSRFSNDKKTLMISPESSLQENQNYQLTVTWNNGKYEWGFQTRTNGQLTESEQIEAQRRADENYGQWSTQINHDYPWLDKLPIKDSQYFVYFDVEKKAFFGVLYVKESDHSQVNSLKAEIEEKLTQLEIPYKEYKLSWEFD